MNKSELIAELAQEAEIQESVAEFVANEIIGAMTTALANGEGIEIRGFGSFIVKEYQAYMGRNPKSGTAIRVSPKKLPFFKVGKELRERVNKGRG
ncbi:MAG: integration host factor subunit beta [Deltaproteobacteria bacterium]|jgi:integration host factor subunit beta|nr:integration host factor subunit beta [Deltaproteobacteria bacterium]